MSLCWVLMTIAAGVSTPATSDAPMALVLPWNAAELTSENRAALNDFLVEDLAKSPRFQVISLQEVNMLLGVERIKDAAGCDNVVCLGEILGALGAPYFVKGSVHRLHGELYFSLVIMDVKHQRVLARSHADYTDDDYFYPFVVHDMVNILLHDIESPKNQSTAKLTLKPN